jgi:hypothetical protein
MQSVLKEKIQNKNVLVGVILLAISLLCAFIRDMMDLSYYSVSIGFNALLSMAFCYGISIIFGLFILRDFQTSKGKTLLTIVSVLLLARQLYWLFDEIVQGDVDTVNYAEYIIFIAAYSYITFLSVKGATKTKLAYILLGLSAAISFIYLTDIFAELQYIVDPADKVYLVTYMLYYFAFDVAFLLIAPKAIKVERVRSVEEELTELKELFDNGIIPEEEYKNKRKEILRKM